MVRVLVKQGFVFFFNKDTVGFSGPATVMRVGDWSKVVSDGIRQL